MEQSSKQVNPSQPAQSNGIEGLVETFLLEKQKEEQRLRDEALAKLIKEQNRLINRIGPFLHQYWKVIFIVFFVGFILGLKYLYDHSEAILDPFKKSWNYAAEGRNLKWTGGKKTSGQWQVMFQQLNSLITEETPGKASSNSKTSCNKPNFSSDAATQAKILINLTSIQWFDCLLLTGQAETLRRFLSPKSLPIINLIANASEDEKNQYNQILLMLVVANNRLGNSDQNNKLSRLLCPKPQLSDLCVIAQIATPADRTISSKLMSNKKNKESGKVPLFSQALSYYLKATNFKHNSDFINAFKNLQQAMRHTPVSLSFWHQTLYRELILYSYLAGNPEYLEKVQMALEKQMQRTKPWSINYIELTMTTIFSEFVMDTFQEDYNSIKILSYLDNEELLTLSISEPLFIDVLGIESWQYELLNEFGPFLNRVQKNLQKHQSNRGDATFKTRLWQIRQQLAINQVKLAFEQLQLFDELDFSNPKLAQLKGSALFLDEKTMSDASSEFRLLDKAAKSNASKIAYAWSAAENKKGLVHAKKAMQSLRANRKTRFESAWIDLLEIKILKLEGNEKQARNKLVKFAADKYKRSVNPFEFIKLCRALDVDTGQTFWENVSARALKVSPYKSLTAAYAPYGPLGLEPKPTWLFAPADIK